MCVCVSVRVPGMRVCAFCVYACVRVHMCVRPVCVCACVCACVCVRDVTMGLRRCVRVRACMSRCVPCVCVCVCAVTIGVHGYACVAVCVPCSECPCPCACVHMRVRAVTLGHLAGGTSGRRSACTSPGWAGTRVCCSPPP